MAFTLAPMNYCFACKCPDTSAVLFRASDSCRHYECSSCAAKGHHPCEILANNPYSCKVVGCIESATRSCGKCKLLVCGDHGSNQSNGGFICMMCEETQNAAMPCNFPWCNSKSCLKFCSECTFSYCKDHTISSKKICTHCNGGVKKAVAPVCSG